MRTPVIAVTGPIASGKSTVARMIASRRGALVNCDRLGHRALEAPEVRRKLAAAFGKGVLSPSGRVSRRKLARIVFSDDRALETLNRIVRPSLTRIITGEVMRRRERAEYIVLDAVLLFRYRFRFKVDWAVVARASRETRLKRIMRRDGLSRAEALLRIERQRELDGAWSRADESIRTDGSLARVKSRAEGIRDRFLDRCGRVGRTRH